MVPVAVWAGARTPSSAITSSTEQPEPGHVCIVFTWSPSSPPFLFLIPYASSPLPAVIDSLVARVADLIGSL
jgi:hypothetical protein